MSSIAEAKVKKGPYSSVFWFTVFDQDQCGGNFIVNKQGKLTYTHRVKAGWDRPTAREILAHLNNSAQ